jgi:oligopeptide/dipeptide ABC transporter ATP-binding protein
VAGVDLALAPREIVGVVGESGSGKSTLALAIAGLVTYPGEVTADRLEFMGADLLDGSRRARSSLLGLRLAVVFQDPMTSLNPALRVGEQIAEKARVHLGAGRKAAAALAVRGLSETHIPGAAARAAQYPHEYSGGMRQRAMIAMGVVTSPTLVIADEPTTALDVTVQAQILELLRELNRDHGTAILFISHDIAVVTELCTRLIVMYAGRVVETTTVADLLEGAEHPYTRALLATVVDLDQDPAQPLATISGRPPALDALPAGCPFAPRCPLVEEQCLVEEPPLLPNARGSVACWVAHRNSHEEAH